MISIGMVSVIVPAYNAEKSIERCVCSVLSQSYSNLEIIVVNDGSTDGTLDCIRKLAQEDSRIVVVDKCNEGVSVARNTGLDRAVGEFCCFVDADDWIDQDHIEKLVSATSKADCVVSGYRKDAETGSVSCQLQEKKYSLELMDDASITAFFVQGHIHPCWNKLFRLDIIQKYHVRFPEHIHISEDSLFCLEYLRYCTKIHICGLPTYHYTINSSLETLSKKVYDDIFDVYESVYLQLDGLCEKGNCPDDIRKNIVLKTIYPQVYVGVLKILCDKSKKWRDRTKHITKMRSKEYAIRTLEYGHKFAASRGERLLLGLILKKRYLLAAVLVEWKKK